ncbi:MAG: C1 family peptidase [Gammaproteobacteria bacterium]|nr:C1 family peptidase [Gammaproteobacteria bacterium]
MRFPHTFIIVCLLSSTAIAQPDIEIKGQITQTIPDTKPQVSATQKSNPTAPKTVTLMDVKLSEHAWKTLNRRAEDTVQHPTPLLLTPPYTTAQSSAQLGMNKVPVMDQGNHGTCATFAVTAAVDAAMNAGDYISQLCQLQLGKHLERSGYSPSGWDGSLNPIVLNQMDTFGIVSKTVQQDGGCGELREYPKAKSAPEQDISLSDYHNISEPLPEDTVAWTPLLDIYQVFLDKTDPQKTLESVKSALRHHDRLTFGVLLFRLNEGVAGAIGKHKGANDTWVLTPDIIKDIVEHNDYGGHAMIITGFSDTATAVDKDGRWHKGLLTIRNSWGPNAGDEGNFYMSYDYFKLLTIEIQRIRSLKPFAT